MGLKTGRDARLRRALEIPHPSALPAQRMEIAGSCGPAEWSADWANGVAETPQFVTGVSHPWMEGAPCRCVHNIICANKNGMAAISETRIIISRVQE